MDLTPILTPLPYCPEREARRAANTATGEAVDALIALAADEARAGRPHEHLLEQAVAVADEAVGQFDSHRRIVNRLFALTLAGERVT